MDNVHCYPPGPRRFHKKRDGILLIEPNGQARFLTLWESLLYRLFKKEPAP